ncbi:LysR family transcriptional regulator [Corynebacterium propinquum]|uniref:LysR family transcriptional regulator n=1 Tax=Corynebacterium TaxID=1716 RepID=UPI002543DECF|nr:LysR family transcriptional regulator [Corynebacterium propinquum]MDK4302647.1 LysR family transcriptional regulator [Corynebacterium propinquum]
MRFRLCTDERLREGTKSVQGYNESMYPARDGDDSRFSSVRRSYVPDALTVDVVLAVARHGGMNQAAKYLNVSQQTVSTRVAKLEKHLNTRIFWRGAAGSSTTKVGHQVIRVLEGLERALNDCAHGLKAATNNAVTEGLKLVVSHTVAEIDYPRWAAAFQRRHPQTHLHMRQLNSREAQRHVIQGDAELALVEGNWVAHELHQRVIGHDELIVAAPAHHPWAKSNNHNDLDMPSASIPVTGTAPITKEELQSTPLVLREQGSGTREVVEDALEGLAPPIGEFGSLGAQRTGIGTLGAPGVIARRAVSSQLATGEYLEVPVVGVNFDRPLRVVWSSKNRLSDPARLFLRFLVDYTDRNAT